MSDRENFTLTCNSFTDDSREISLKEQCLNVIVRHFRRFYFAFTTKDDSLKRPLTFLKRNYSFELLSKLFEAKDQKDEYIKMLMNEHLKILHCKWFTGTRYQTNMDGIFHLLPNITTIHFDRYCRDKYLKSIAKFCPKIEVLDMSHSFVTDNGIMHLREQRDDGTIPCPNLRIIFSEGTCITKEAIKFLIRSLPSLEEVKDISVPLVLESIYKQDMLKFGKVQSYNLLCLNLLQIKYLPYCKDLLKMCLTVCSRLKCVTCYISDEEQLNLFTSPNLEEVRLEMGQSINVNNFLKIKRSNLVTLELVNCKLSISKLAVCCRKLKKLSAENVTLVDDDSIDSQPFFHNLTSCCFSYIKDENLTNKAMRLLLSSPKLESIKISSHYCVLSSDAKTDVIKYCENQLVKEIFFGCSLPEINFIKHILISCPSLVTLRVKDSYRDLPEIMEIFELAKTLPNKPKIQF